MVLLNILIPLTLLISCGKQKFAAGKHQQGDSTNPIIHQTIKNPEFSKFTLIRPKVDLLLLIDNSGSFNIHLNKNIKEGISKLLNYLSKDFDYQIMVAPIIPDQSKPPEYFVIDYDSSNLQGIPPDKIIPLGLASEKILTFSPGKEKEKGLDRIQEIFTNFSTSGVFRNNSHLIVNLISNGDDISGDDPTPYDINIYAPTKHIEIKNLVETNFNPLHFRFLSIVPHNKPCDGVKASLGTYKEVSRRFYDDTPSTFKTKTDNSDSFNICDVLNFLSVYNSINKTINPDLLRHGYDHWPIILTTDQNYLTEKDLDPEKMTVSKILTSGIEEILTSGVPNGFEMIGFQENLNIRETINGKLYPGEPYTGFFIKLNGTGKVIYPEYIKIETQTKTHYYGYVKFDYKPEISSIILKINGREIPKTEWEYIDGPETRNIRIKSPTDFTTPDGPAVNRTGWFIKLKSEAVYSNSSTLNLYYFPSQ
jgi:hypothetical protein